ADRLVAGDTREKAGEPRFRALELEIDLALVVWPRPQVELQAAGGVDEKWLRARRRLEGQVESLDCELRRAVVEVGEAGAQGLGADDDRSADRPHECHPLRGHEHPVAQ